MHTYITTEKGRIYETLTSMVIKSHLKSLEVTDGQTGKPVWGFIKCHISGPPLAENTAQRSEVLHERFMYSGSWYYSKIICED